MKEKHEKAVSELNVSANGTVLSIIHFSFILPVVRFQW